jgi:aromatic ring-opening dioxygenase catalytic subunit (LigB family)
VIHIEELEIELIKTGSLTHDMTLEVSARGRHEKTQTEFNKMIPGRVETLSYEIKEQKNILTRRL